uniref:Uncharacterized protein LOC114330096 n=1 Tax=Diabrotica virgifera virgifera TaxID=50390 RepID=A0A6P7FH13_DIAVI
MITNTKDLPSVNAVVLAVEKKIKELESMITDTKVQPSVNAVALDPVEKDEIPRDETSHNVRFKLPPFDGKSSSSIYLRQFKAIATANHWTEQEKAVSLTAALRGDAADILRSIPKGQEKCYQTLFTRLEKRYGDAHLQQVYKAQLRSRSQRASDNLQEFEADVARVVRLAYSEASDSILEEIALDTFVNGLKESELQNALRLARPKVLDEALAIALEHEAASQASRNNRVLTVEKGYKRKYERLDEMVWRVIRDTMPKRAGRVQQRVPQNEKSISAWLEMTKHCRSDRRWSLSTRWRMSFVGRPYKLVMTHLKNHSVPTPTCPQLLRKIVTALLPQLIFYDLIEKCEAEEIPSITEDQLMEACNRVGNSKAPGLDGITNISLTADIKESPAMFLEVNNTYVKHGWQGRYFPALTEATKISASQKREETTR